MDVDPILRHATDEPDASGANATPDLLEAAFDAPTTVSWTQSREPAVILDDIARIIVAREAHLLRIQDAMQHDSNEKGAVNPTALQRYNQEYSSLEQVRGMHALLLTVELSPDEAEAARDYALKAAQDPFQSLCGIELYLTAREREGKITAGARDALQVSLRVVQTLQKQIGQLIAAAAAEAVATDGAYSNEAVAAIQGATTQMNDLSIRGSRLLAVSRFIDEDQARRIRAAAQQGPTQLEYALDQMFHEATTAEAAANSQ